jgi:hypothetical protein
MRALCYFAGLVCALPCSVFALGIVVLNHVIVTRNVFKLFYEFLLAFGWGLPVLVLFLGAMVAAGFFVHGRLVACFMLIILNLAALVIILMSPAAPREMADLFFLVPPIASLLFAGLLIFDYFRAPAVIMPPPTAV